MSDAQKLTKKQRKGLAFRQRGKARTAEHETPGGDVPIAENLDDDGPAHHANTNDQPARSSPIVEKQKTEDQGKPKVSAKRKRSDDAGQAPSPKKQKKVVEKSTEEDGEQKGTSKKQQQQQRFILFVGQCRCSQLRSCAWLTKM